MGFYIPETIKSLDNWALWKLENNKKVPYQVKENRRASVDKSEQWGSYYDALQKIEHTGEYNGLGFLFKKADNLTFIDLDNCIDIDTGELTEFATSILNSFSDTYVEVSQSETGLHIVCKGSLPANIKKKEIEIYSFSRYMAFTGNAIAPVEPSNKQEELNGLFRLYKPTETENATQTALQGLASGFCDAVVIERCERWADFHQLYYFGVHDFTKADGQPDASRADFRLSFILLSCNGGNKEQAERLFMKSRLAQREKIKRADYVCRTIAAAALRLPDQKQSAHDRGNYAARVKKSDRKSKNRVYW